MSQIFYLGLSFYFIIVSIISRLFFINVIDILNEISMLKKYMEKMHFSHFIDCISGNMDYIIRYP